MARFCTALAVSVTVLLQGPLAQGKPLLGEVQAIRPKPAEHRLLKRFRIALDGALDEREIPLVNQVDTSRTRTAHDVAIAYQLGDLALRELLAPASTLMGAHSLARTLGGLPPIVDGQSSRAARAAIAALAAHRDTGRPERADDDSLRPVLVAAKLADALARLPQRRAMLEVAELSGQTALLSLDVPSAIARRTTANRWRRHTQSVALAALRRIGDPREDEAANAVVLLRAEIDFVLGNAALAGLDGDKLRPSSLTLDQIAKTTADIAIRQLGAAAFELSGMPDEATFLRDLPAIVDAHTSRRATAHLEGLAKRLDPKSCLSDARCQSLYELAELIVDLGKAASLATTPRSELTPQTAVAPLVNALETWGPPTGGIPGNHGEHGRAQALRTLIAGLARIATQAQ